MIVDLKNYIDRKVVLTGYSYGVLVRRRTGIDKIEKNNENIKIIIPKNIYSITPSFFEGLFINIIKKIGKEEFKNRFIFISDYNYTKSLNESIYRILILQKYEQDDIRYRVGEIVRYIRYHNDLLSTIYDISIPNKYFKIKRIDVEHGIVYCDHRSVKISDIRKTNIIEKVIWWWLW